MPRISSCYIVTAIVCLTVGCGPAFEPNHYYGLVINAPGGGSSNGGPVLNDPILPATANVIRNSTFDQQMNLWEDWGGSSYLTYGAYDGSGLRISGTDQGGAGQEILFRVKTGATYQLRAQGKVGTVNDAVYMGVRFFDLSNATISDQKVRVSTTVYASHALSITVPQGCSSAKVYVWKDSTVNSTADFDEFSLVMTSPPPAPPKEAFISNPNDYRPLGPAGNYRLVFDESFNGSGLNSTYWNTGLWFNATINGEQQAYRPENARVGAGNLQLVAENRSTTTTWGDTMSYASGAITTRNKFAFTFGVVEARARLPQGAGLSSLLYLEPNNKRAPPEINMINALGQTPQTVGFFYKFFDVNGAVRALIGAASGTNFSDAFHVFTVDWNADAIRFYVDGALRGSYTGDSILRDDAFIVLSLALGGAAGEPSAASMPQTYEVDYIRVWQ